MTQIPLKSLGVGKHCASAAFAAGSMKRGFDLVMLTSDLASMVAGARRQLDDLKAATPS